MPLPGRKSPFPGGATFQEPGGTFQSPRENVPKAGRTLQTPGGTFQEKPGGTFQKPRGSFLIQCCSKRGKGGVSGRVLRSEPGFFGLFADPADFSAPLLQDRLAILLGPSSTPPSSQRVPVGLGQALGRRRLDGGGEPCPILLPLPGACSPPISRRERGYFQERPILTKRAADGTG